ncbi:MULTISPECIES: methyltransferase domain-containing protein [unclassified Streptomyces]|uniref:methyltransferase domain-containing protein n=1 Tax=unclassified Streptomyces TaxID=2593676 RepID=UPI002DDB21F3|nr:methyltransferase domain-containing protein [Streptomyces sp. NBC_01750]WSA99281.1 methyltransferase domain-containing protein [Streptomyces sp. NBC_01794]WSD36152.1 methyltransferase domain-containing protein [Streptomyces sp. NBC_01750]
MSDVRSHLKSLERSNRSMTNPDRPRTFSMVNREWDLLDEVFAPIYSPSTGIALEFLGLTGTNSLTPSSSLLEIGCGAGVIAIQAALAGCTTVAADINENAVENTRLNAERHGVSDRVTALHSDLFDALDDGARFDRIFWSSNYVLAPADYTYRSVHERAYVDAGYRTHRRYLEEAVHHLTDTGSVLLHFCERGDIAGLERIAEECGRELRVLRRRTVLEGQDLIEHTLLEVLPGPLAEAERGSRTSERIAASGARRGARRDRAGAAPDRNRPVLA